MSRPDYRSQEAQEYRAWYRDPRWRGKGGVREQQLAKQPLCEACLRMGRTVPATVCNHADPESKASEATFFDGPFSSLCQPCHDAGEQKAERAGYSAEAGPDGWPLSPDHPANGGCIR